MDTFLILGSITALGVIIIFYRIGIRRVLRWGAGVDVLVSVGLAAWLANTFMGVMTALIAGVLISGFLLIAKLFL